MLIKNDRDLEQGPFTGNGKESAGAENDHFLIKFQLKVIRSRSRGRLSETGKSWLALAMIIF